MTRSRLEKYNRLSTLDRLLSPRSPVSLPCPQWERLHAERVVLQGDLGYGPDFRPWGPTHP